EVRGDLPEPSGQLGLRGEELRLTKSRRPCAARAGSRGPRGSRRKGPSGPFRMAPLEAALPWAGAPCGAQAGNRARAPDFEGAATGLPDEARRLSANPQTLRINCLSWPPGACPEGVHTWSIWRNMRPHSYST